MSFKFSLSKTAPKRKKLESATVAAKFQGSDGIVAGEEEPVIIVYEEGQKFDTSLPVPVEKPALVIPCKIPDIEISLPNVSERLEKKAKIMESEEFLPSLKPKNNQINDNETIDVEITIQKPKRPLLLGSINPILLTVKSDEERFQLDLQNRAEDMDFRSDNYDNVPVEEFGAALLRGMGWKGPSDDDKDRLKKLDQPMTMRDGRLGLGAMSKPPEDKRKRNGEKTKEWNEKVMQSLKKQSIAVNDLVWIRNPNEAGKRAQVVMTAGVPGLNKLRVRMELDGRIIDLLKTDVVLLTSTELEENPYGLTYKDIAYSIETQYVGMNTHS